MKMFFLGLGLLTVIVYILIKAFDFNEELTVLIAGLLWWIIMYGISKLFKV